MFSQRKILKSTKDHSAEIDRLKNEIETADAIVIGAGSGLSTAAGFTYSGERFEKYFSDFIEKYQFRDMYSGGFLLDIFSCFSYCRKRAKECTNLIINAYCISEEDKGV